MQSVLPFGQPSIRAQYGKLYRRECGIDFLLLRILVFHYIVLSIKKKHISQKTCHISRGRNWFVYKILLLELKNQKTR
jgi:hypothetical protein